MDDGDNINKNECVDDVDYVVDDDDDDDDDNVDDDSDDDDPVEK